MINFRQKNEVMPSALILVSLIALTLTFAFYGWIWWVNTHPTGITARASELRLHRMQEETTDIKNQQAAALRFIAPKVWSGDVEQVSASVLAQLTAECKQQNVTIGSFRPSKPTMINGVTELPFTVQMTGAYKGLHAVLSSIDAPVSRVVLQSAQITSAQVSKNTLTANLEMASFVNTNPDEVASAAQPAEKVQTKQKPKGAKS
jgi:hypothetical protein